MRPSAIQALAAAVGILLVVAVVTAFVGLEDGSTPRPADRSARGGSDPGATGSGTRAPTAEATARAVAYEGGIVDLPSLTLAGAPRLRTHGEVADAAGAPLGKGSLAAAGGTLGLAGAGLAVDLAYGELRLAGGTARLLHRAPGFSLATVAAPRLIVTATTLSFTPDGASQPRQLAGPVTVVVDGGTSDVEATGDVEWTDPPPVVRLEGRRARTTLSWAGTGVVRSGDMEHRAGYLGIKASSLRGSAERTGADVRLVVDADLLQVYADGVPKLPGKGRVRVKSRPGKVPRGTGGSFTWAPENDGHTDFVMTRIRPGNAEAGWVSLGLDPLPAMCGGEPCPKLGGDTSGFRKGRPINAVIIPGTGDERTISFLVPIDAALGAHRIVLVVEGNFEPIEVVVEVDVVEPPPTTTTTTTSRL